MVGLALAVTSVSACSAERVLAVTAFGPCVYNGPSELAAGEHELVVSGDARVDVYLLDTYVDFDDIAAHYESVDALRHPPGGTRIFGVVNEAGLRHDRSPQNSTSRRHMFRPGEYAIVCEWSAGDSSGRRAVSQLTVSG